MIVIKNRKIRANNNKRMLMKRSQRTRRMRKTKRSLTGESKAKNIKRKRLKLAIQLKEKRNTS